MMIDSHCHLDRIDLAPYQNDLGQFMDHLSDEQISHLLCVSIDLDSLPAMWSLVKDFNNICISVGVHPNVKLTVDQEPSVDDLINIAQHKRVVAIGETGLDYFRSEGDLSWQHQRMRTHIQAAKQLKLPIIIHTREAKDDTLKLLREEGADEVGGVIHCFTEDWEMACQAMDLGFYISFSGIVTFKNALSIQDVASRIEDEKFFIETDSPYLAPVPHRGKPNYPSYVKHVAEKIAELRDTSVEKVCESSTRNYHRLFTKVSEFAAQE
ncbi:MAG TPA: TatD family deoxyribonuclease [Crenotrichaceae bacterium]|nr:TatD family deoxyribonuclease [Crenotrichaceae bacterium]